MTWVDFIIRLLLALILGAAIGIERQWRRTRSVLKTNVLVALGSAMFVMMSSMVPGEASPTRVAAQVVSGVGFLGGGVILRQLKCWREPPLALPCEGASVRGLNTAATLWCSAAIGTFVGTGLLFQAYFGTLAVVGANLLLRPLVQWFQELDTQLITHTKLEARYCCYVVCFTIDEANVRALLLDRVEDSKLTLIALSSKNIDLKNLDNSAQIEIKADFLSQGRSHVLLEQLVALIKSKVRVNVVKWELVSDDAE